jgi:DNA modification methylase
VTARVLDGDYEPRVSVDRLHPHPRNPRRGDVARLEQLIDDNGFVGAVLAQRSTGFILAGNHRTAAARTAGLAEIPVLWLDVDDDTALRIMLGDNRASDDAVYDDHVLADLLGELEASAAGLAGTGYTDQALADLLERVGTTTPRPRAGADDVPQLLPVAPRTRLGDVWLLGPHRLVCGDCADPKVVARALDGGEADLVFTSPPYNVDVDYGEHDDRTTDWGPYGAFLERCLDGFAGAVRPGGALAWNLGTSPKTYPHRQAALIEARGLTYVRQLVWRKTGVPVPTWYHTARDHRARYFTPNYVHELVLVFTPDRAPAKPSRPDPADAAAVFYRRPFDPTPDHELVVVFAKGRALAPGARVAFDQTLEHDVFEVNQAASTRDLPAGRTRTGARSNLDRRAHKAHPCPFPVGLPAAFIRHLADVGAWVLDPFAGAGSTIIACHATGRRGAAVELDPAYCDLIALRWQDHTGELPRLEATGEPVDMAGLAVGWQPFDPHGPAEQAS